MENRRNNVYIILIALLLLGLFTGRSVLFTLALFVAAIFILALFWSFLATSGIRLSRTTRTRRSQVGRKFVEQFRVYNKSILPKLWLEIRDFSTLPNHKASFVTPSLTSWGQYDWRVETLCLVRGEFQLGPISITSSDPFGLFNIPKIINTSERLIVYPTILPITQFQLPSGFLSGGEAQRQITQNVTTNAAGVREYVMGDSINRIHWKSTAKRNKLIVKEFELDPLVDIWLFVDFSKESLVEAPTLQRLGTTGTVIPSGQTIPHSTEEYAVVIASSLVSYFIEQERAIGFIAYAPHREVYTPERGNRQLTRILETLAVARSQTSYTMHEMLASEAHSFTRGTTLIFITSSTNPRWLPELQILSQRGVRPVCIYLEPTSFGGIHSSKEIRGNLQLLKIPTYSVSCGDDIPSVLAHTTR